MTLQNQPPAGPGHAAVAAKAPTGRPVLLTAIASVSLLAAAIQLLYHTNLVRSRHNLPAVAQTVVDSYSVVDWISPYVLGSLLFVSGIMLLRRRRVGMLMFGSYGALWTLVTIQQALTTVWLDILGPRAPTIIGVPLVAILAAFGYLWRLGKGDVLQ